MKSMMEISYRFAAPMSGVYTAQDD